MNNYSTIIIDDEAHARQQLERYLTDFRQIELVAICGSGEEAIKEIMGHHPDIVFLDIEMPEIDGFDIIDAVSNSSDIYWVFVTAYDQYAVKAFEIEAHDYLLKPFDKKRLMKTVSRAVERLTDKENKEEMPDTFNPLEKILVKDNEQIRFINCDDIVKIASEGNYVNIYTRDSNYTIRYVLKDIMEKLDPRKFFRVHRSMVVNIEYIETMEPWFSGDYKIELKNGEEIKMSRNYKDLLQEFK